MTSTRLRLLTLVAMASAILAGCAVPGKGEPGVLAVYNDRVITDDDVAAIRQGLNELFSGPNAGEDLTLLLIGPEVVAIAEDLGYDLTDQYLSQRASQWVSLASKGVITQADLTTGAREVVRVVDSINLLMHDPDGIAALVGLVMDIEANAVISPRYGDFTLAQFSESVSTIQQYIQENELALSVAQFTAWKDLDGFSVIGRPEWISGG